MTGSSFVFLLVGHYKRGSDDRVLEGRETDPGSGKEAGKQQQHEAASLVLTLTMRSNVWWEESGNGT